MDLIKLILTVGIIRLRN